MSVKVRHNPNPTHRLLNIYHNANPASVAEGLAWYESAHAIAACWADGTPYTVRQVIGVIAALSPRLHWARNLKVAAIVLKAHAQGRSVAEARVATGCFLQRIVAAYRILDGIDEYPAGIKVQTFARAIEGDETNVVLDVWAFRAAISTKHDGAYTADEWRVTRDAFLKAAELAHVTPRQFQAVVWVAVRGRAS